MNRFEKLSAPLTAMGFLLIAGMGVDMNQTRTGFGMVVLGFGMLVLSLGVFVSGGLRTRPVPQAFVVAGGVYYLWRSFSGGPGALALADGAIILLVLGVYLAVSSSGVVGRKVLLAALAVLCLINLVVAATQYSSGNNFYIWSENPDGDGSTTGLFGHYNPFASFLNGSLFFFLTIACTGKHKIWRISCALLSMGLVFGMIASGSRGGFLALMVGGFVWMVLMLIELFRTKSRLFGPALILTVVLVVAGGVSSGGALKKITESRLERQFGEEYVEKNQVKVQDGGRLVFQQMAFEIFQKSPVVGSGPRSFSYLALEEWDPDELWLWMGNPEFAHNEFLQMLADYGAIGFVIALGLIFAHAAIGLIGICWGSSDDSSCREGKMLRIGALAGLAAVLAQCFFSFLIHIPSCAVLVAFQFGLIASVDRLTSVARAPLFRKIIPGLILVSVSGCLLALGWQFSQSFMIRRDAENLQAKASSQEDYIETLNLYRESASLGRDAGLYAGAARWATDLAARRFDQGLEGQAKEFHLIAKKSFEDALALNPHQTVALAGLPRANDALGNFSEADRGHHLAVEKIGIREVHLKPRLYSARSAFIQGVLASVSGKSGEALKQFRRSKVLLTKRRDFLHEYREKEDEKKLRVEIEAWIAYLEGERLAIEGDRIWKNARPRNPELAYALMLEAAKRYEASEKVVEPLVKRWKPQWTRLQENLELLKLVRTKPATLTEEQISEIINPEAVLDPAPATR